MQCQTWRALKGKHAVHSHYLGLSERQLAVNKNGNQSGLTAQTKSHVLDRAAQGLEGKVPSEYPVLGSGII